MSEARNFLRDLIKKYDISTERKDVYYSKSGYESKKIDAAKALKYAGQKNIKFSSILRRNDWIVRVTKWAIFGSDLEESVSAYPMMEHALKVYSSAKGELKRKKPSITRLFLNVCPSADFLEKLDKIILSKTGQNVLFYKVPNSTALWNHIHYPVIIYMDKFSDQFAEEVKKVAKDYIRNSKNSDISPKIGTVVSDGIIYNEDPKKEDIINIVKRINKYPDLLNSKEVKKILKEKFISAENFWILKNLLKFYENNYVKARADKYETAAKKISSASARKIKEMESYGSFVDVKGRKLGSSR